jgi:hypothetical protein
MRKITIEVDMDELSVPGQNAVAVLLSDRSKLMPDIRPYSGDPVQNTIDGLPKEDWRSSLDRAASKFMGIIRAEQQGNQLRIIMAYIAKKSCSMTNEELQAASGKKGPALAGTMSSLTKNWRKAGMTGRKGINWDIGCDLKGHYFLAGGDANVLDALTKAAEIK